MLSALSSFIWGTESGNSPEKSDIVTNVQVELENDWIYIKHKGKTKKQQVQFTDEGGLTTSESTENTNHGLEESWIVAPPQCFNSKRRGGADEMNPMENLLIEHPSMSIYKKNDENSIVDNNNENRRKDVILLSKVENHRAVAGRLLQLENRPPLKDLSAKLQQQKSNSPKSLMRKNRVHVRHQSSRKNKQYGRMTGKHVGMINKRGT